MDGSATLTIEASITTTNCVIASNSRAMFFARGVSRGDVWGWGDVWGSVTALIES